MWDRRVVEVIDGVEMNFIAKADLILAKKASGRVQDIIDVESLEKS